MGRERQKPVVELDLACRRVVVRHQRPSVVEKHLGRNAAEVSKRGLQAAEPRRLSLVPERLDMTTPRVAQRRHEQVHAHTLVRDRNAQFPEINL